MLLVVARVHLHGIQVVRWRLMHGCLMSVLVGRRGRIRLSHGGLRAVSRLVVLCRWLLWLIAWLVAVALVGVAGGRIRVGLAGILSSSP
jgi:hypothetical protein